MFSICLCKMVVKSIHILFRRFSIPSSEVEGFDTWLSFKLKSILLCDQPLASGIDTTPFSAMK